ncbi:MAG: ABC transporter ATP-binding protein [Alphaproteobacteria bacterium]|nr:ABC transporter ATP-binding protein [Alphaproteobacteria bacterium]
MTELLAIDGATVRFGGIVAVDDVSFALNRGELLGLIGPNGAGKTTMLRVITGVVRPTQGVIRLDGADITTKPTDRRTRDGLSLTHQIVRPLRSLSALDNVAFAAGHAKTANVLRALLTADRSAEQARARQLLGLVGIAEYAGAMPGTMPLGALKRLEVARALALDPQVLLLDEPLAGLNHVEAARLADTIVALNKSGLSIVLIEHNLGEVLRICQRLVVLDNGRRIAIGAPRTVIDDPVVRAAYLGRKAGDAAA